MLIIIVSFFLTGTISFYHFKSENEQYHRERLKRKEYAVNESIDYFLRDQDISENTDSIVRLFDDKICELADINNMDINIYGLNGNLLISSRPELFEQNVLPEELGKMILFSLNQNSEQLIMKSKGDSIEYLSTYDFIYNFRDKPIAIINMPYFETEDISRQDISDFLVRLGEIYFLLFLGAGIIAYFLSNYITGSLQAIGAKMKSVKFNKENPPIEWRFDDEIGTLVNEYNRMLKELEQSAKKLAKTEREGAWKEMAKQVAHEIKNPLTPMRLNVQYLEKTLKTKDPEKLKEFTSGMISQIDTLSNIAEAFSRFANMPELKAETFSVYKLLQKAIALYPNYSIENQCDDPETRIMGDREQLIRVMNNLINNAIQAIPEDREPELKLTANKKGKSVIIALSDNGCGIPEEQHDKIFEPRFTTKTKGMGLGLAMVKNIITSFEGKIWLESEVEKGTTFYLSLPTTD